MKPREFVALLYRGVNPHAGQVEFRFLPKPAGSAWMPWPAFEGHPQEFTIDRTPAGKSAYLGVALRRDTSSGERENCHPTHLQWVDLDLERAPNYTGGLTKATLLETLPAELGEYKQRLFADALAICEERNIPPRAVVDSGHGLHLYWARRTTPSGAGEIEPTNATLAALFADLGADPSVKDLPRVLRLPGGLNIKNPARPLPVQVILSEPDAWVEREALEALPKPQGKAKPAPAPAGGFQPLTVAAPDSGSVVGAFNDRYPITELLERYGYRREDAKTYTRPGDGASGRDVKLLPNVRGVLCSYHHSSNDPLADGPGDGHLREPFDLFTEYEHGGNAKAAAKAAAALLGMSHAGRSISVGAGKSGPAGDGAPAEEGEDGGRKSQPPAGTRVLEYAQEDGAELWHDQSGNAYLTVTTGEHREHYRLPSRAARDYLLSLYYTREKRALNGQAQAEVLGLMQAIARRDGNEHRTAVRVAHLNGFTYLDLGTSSWEAVEVGKGYWKTVKAHECPVRFTRPPGFHPLPVPVEGGDVGELREFLNTDDRGFMMCVAWLLGALSGLSPYPLLALNGEQGTGKSVSSSMLRKLIDPNQADRRRSPKEERDLFIAAQSSHVLSFDNLSSIPPWLSDSLCVLSTGGAFTARTLYSDGEETILEAVRPVIVNGIPDLLARPDLAERALTIMLYRIPGHRRAPEVVIWARYERARPRILGALLTALAGALARLESTTLKDAPRLADFARLIVAAEPGLPWGAGAFLHGYGLMQSEAATTVLEGEPVAEAVRRLIDDEEYWEGTVEELRLDLSTREYPDSRPPQGWPRTARALGSALRRLAPALAKTGYQVTPLKRTKRGELYHLAKSGEEATKTGEEKYTMYTAPLEAVQDGISAGVLPGTDVHPSEATYTAPSGAGVLTPQPVNIDPATYTEGNAVQDGAGVRGVHGELPSASDSDGTPEGMAPSAGEL